MAHLNELFSKGKLITLTHPTLLPEDVELWIARLNPTQQEMVMKKSRAARARRFQELKDPASDEGLSVRLDVDQMNKAEVVDALLERKKTFLRQQALNELLFSKETEKDSGKTDHGTYWGDGGELYTDVIDALLTRSEEIEDHNREQAAGGGGDKIEYFEDPEIIRLNAVQEQFAAEHDARYEALADVERSDISHATVSVLRDRLFDERITLDSDMHWMVVRTYEQAYFACRYPEDHKKLYFNNADDVRALPQVIQDQLLGEVEIVDVGVEEAKKSLTPLPSLP